MKTEKQRNRETEKRKKIRKTGKQGNRRTKWTKANKMGICQLGTMAPPLPPPLFKSVRSDEYAWNAIFSKSTWYGDLKSDVYTIYKRYIGYAGGYMDDI